MTARDRTHLHARPPCTNCQHYRRDWSFFPFWRWMSKWAKCARITAGDEIDRTCGWQREQFGQCRSGGQFFVRKKGWFS